MIRGLVRVWSGLDTNAPWEVAWAGSAPDRGTTERTWRLERLHLGCREQKGGGLGKVDRRGPKVSWPGREHDEGLLGLRKGRSWAAKCTAPTFRDELADAIKDFFQINIGSVDSICTVWETFKLYIRGINIAKHAEDLQMIPGRLDFLEKELTQLEREHLRTSDSQKLGRIHTKFVEFQDTALTEVQHMGKYATARIYGEGE
ncbi:hypothetical protein NDU88_004452 [Pleurodeles waltl]|uniref:Retrotransposon gag domain-containing protein n=1 Tax=Pleurodeles waltl TaxID=8319 RepID=A0AAV7PFT0_PLEWA|nr:hypothetical protein NDU88_004452 [Pleurodeles waltl]